jgi:hypothetical protein
MKSLLDYIKRKPIKIDYWYAKRSTGDVYKVKEVSSTVAIESMSGSIYHISLDYFDLEYYML